MPSKSIHCRTPQKAVELAENGAAPSTVQLMKTGAFNHPFYGLMRISEQTFSDMVSNVNKDVRQQRLPIDYSHKSDEKAAGWLTRVYTDASGGQLWGDIEWTPAGRKAIEEKEFMYFSADFYFQWEDPETGLVYDNVLNGGGLTNRPFLKGMKSVAQFSEDSDVVMLSELSDAELNQGEQMKTADQLNAEIKTLGESVKAKESELTVLSEKNKALETEVSLLKGEKAKILAEKEKADKLAKFEELCRNGKAVAAQQEAYMSGDLLKFAELAKGANVVNAGSGEGAQSSQLSDEDKATCKALGISEADFLKYNK